MVAVTAGAALAIALPVSLLARSRAARRGQHQETQLVAELTEAARGWQAEARYWKTTALRLQAELEAGGGEGSGPDPGRVV